MAMVRRWWPLAAGLLAVLVVQRLAYTDRYDVGGHAAEHLGSGSFVFFATFVSGVLLWLAPSARRSPIVLIGLAAWLAAGVAIAIGNVQVVDALIESGQAFTGTDSLRDVAAVSDAHGLADSAPLVAVAAAMVVTFGLHHSGVISTRVAIVAAVLNVLIPYWIVPGFGLAVVAGVLCVNRVNVLRRGVRCAGRAGGGQPALLRRRWRGCRVDRPAAEAGVRAQSRDRVPLDR
jgi:hypothetical protein